MIVNMLCALAGIGTMTVALASIRYELTRNRREAQ